MGETEFDGEGSLGTVAQSLKKNLRTEKVKLDFSSASPSPSAKPAKATVKIKKEEPIEDEDDNEFIASKNRRISGSIKQAKKETLYDSDDNQKPISARSSSSFAKSDKVKESNKKKSVEKVTKKVKLESKTESPAKKARKVYALPGQKRDPPEERDPLRIFYESLYKQIPTSEMAQIWMLESGLLDKDVAQKVFERKQKKPSLSASKKSVSVSVSASKPTRENSGQKKASAGDPKQVRKRKNLDDSEEDSDGVVVAKRSIKKQRAS